MKVRSLGFILLALLAGDAEASPIPLPVYIEDSHAGSFYWLAEHLDLDEECTLIHFDAHSDASALFDSDKLRERFRRVSSLEERRQVLERWRQAGVIQCFNWIEPLMPAPIAKVIWVRGRHLNKTNARELQKEAVEHFDGQLEAAPRASGSFRERCRVVGFDKLRSELKEPGPVVISIDLDYFAGVRANEQAAEFERVWKFVAECRNLRAVTIAISRPYLADDAEADNLLHLALTASLSLPTATIHFEPFEKVGNDRSLRARQLRAQKKEIPAFALANVSEKVRAILLANRERITVRTDSAAWERILGDWEKETPVVRLAIKDREPSTDNIWRLPVSEAAELELQTEPGEAAIERIEWIALRPVYGRCDVTTNRAGEIDFAKGAPPRPRWREVILPGRNKTLALGGADKGAAPEELGALRVKARVKINGHLRETPPIEIRRLAGSGFRAAITEQFGLPYLFGSGELRDGPNTGPETGWGADCANFVVYALRRQGRAVPWSNPKQLRKYLEPLGQNVRVSEARVSDEEIAGGMIVHLGSHVAAVMQDRPPLGRLDSSDLVAHQLEGVPEMLSLGQLLKTRQTERFDLLRAQPAAPETDLLLGGDVMLGRTVGDQIRNGADPLAGIRPQLDRAFWKMVNLECVLSDRGTAAAGKRYSLRGPVEAIRILADARINAVGLANNHAADFGPEGLLDSIVRLRASEIAALGAGETPEAASTPHFFTARNGVKVAVIALSDVDDDFARSDTAIARATPRELVARAIAEARAHAAFVLCLVHWGAENTGKITERQRELARWLIDHDVDAVVGSHPHCLQPMDFYHGRPIIYSLGNLVFDGAPSLPAWNKGQLLEINLPGAGTRQASFRLIAIQLDVRGFPQMAEPKEIEERRFTNRRPQ